MNLTQIITMIGRMFMRKAVNIGINKGIDLAARKGKSEATMTAADHDQARKARETVKTARKAARLTRRLGR